MFAWKTSGPRLTASLGGRYPDVGQLDRVIQAAMGWTHSHLHEFEIAGQRYGIPDNEWPDDKPVLDERRSHVGTVLGELELQKTACITQALRGMDKPNDAHSAIQAIAKSWESERSRPATSNAARPKFVVH